MTGEGRTTADLIEWLRSFEGPGSVGTNEAADELEAAERIRRLHEVATEQNVKLAAVIEKARAVAGGYAFTGLRYALTNTHDGPLAVDSSAVLAEHDAKVIREWVSSRFETADYYDAKPHKAADDLTRVLREGAKTDE